MTRPADLSRHPTCGTGGSSVPLIHRHRYSLRAHFTGDSRIPRFILKVRPVGRSLRSSRCLPDSLLLSITTSHQCLLERYRVPNSRKSLFRTHTGFKNRHTTRLTAQRGRCLRRIDRFPPAHWFSAINTLAMAVGVSHPRHDRALTEPVARPIYFYQPVERSA
ncbi:MAG: hypothetical protein QOH35_5984 [Acidobacteriaceae bacterium]|nr:hypothetical protein [Acidobacteriaceae bacterium]